MRLVRRSIAIALKAARLGGLLVMVRCFGPEGTACLLWGLRAAAGRAAATLRSLIPLSENP